MRHSTAACSALPGSHHGRGGGWRSPRCTFTGWSRPRKCCWLMDLQYFTSHQLCSDWLSAAAQVDEVTYQFSSVWRSNRDMGGFWLKPPAGCRCTVLEETRSLVLFSFQILGLAHGLGFGASFISTTNPQLGFGSVITKWCMKILL